MLIRYFAASYFSQSLYPIHGPSNAATQPIPTKVKTYAGVRLVGELGVDGVSAMGALVFYLNSLTAIGLGL